MIVKLIGGKNDGALINVPRDNNSGWPPFKILIQYKQGQLKYKLQEFVPKIVPKNSIAIYEYSGIYKEEAKAHE